MILEKARIDDMDRIYRANLMNALGGYKSANLIGTRSTDGRNNVAVFGTVIHVGSNPPLFGFLSRPTTVRRDTYSNIKSTGYFTINHISRSFIDRAHQTSAKYDIGISEFNTCNLTELEGRTFNRAPFVLESPIRLGLKFVEEHKIAANGTILIIGQAEEIHLPDGAIESDGFLDLSKLDIVTVNGLDGYARATEPIRFAYARPEDSDSGTG